ncbi:hypothetical protein [Parabacteroides sp. PF5-9]|uniref:hypothetical protein n=1 Tax=Parabacteroides sp. PF5-9 TaxID=1742404 RepID=UPI002473E838|nr:hypothetical protein [Parabacteroides sp. PF5-9]MDH6358762.1 lysophospholipase L1-like esterase [Parabacteroides sp. PF5-9]
MENKNYMGHLLALLIFTLIICFTLYELPDHMLGFKIKRIDLFSDIRIKSNNQLADSLQILLAQEDSIQIDSVAVMDSIALTTGLNTQVLAQRDSLYKSLFSPDGMDGTGERIEDYSPGHIGLKHFFTALNKQEEINRPVRVAFLGDSFIEGDILVGDLRSGLQKIFGGRGVGFIPIHSVSAQYRPTVEAVSDGWKTYSIMAEKNHNYTLPGMFFEPQSQEVSMSIKSTKYFSEKITASSLKLIYNQNKQTVMSLKINNESDSLTQVLPPTQKITQTVLEGEFTDAQYTFTETDGFRALGVALEDNTGIVVDNFSLRGNSGIILDRLSAKQCQSFSEIRPYDLIILQYGLNVASQDMLEYGWYVQRMVHIIQHIQTCFPNTDILLLSVSDRAYMEDGNFKTMPGIMALVHAQRQIAKRAGIPFWNMFGAMGGENSIVKYVENSWASKDYTHLSFRGGREIATALIDALIKEKEFYEKAEDAIH